MGLHITVLRANDFFLELEDFRIPTSKLNYEDFVERNTKINLIFLRIYEPRTTNNFGLWDNK